MTVGVRYLAGFVAADLEAGVEHRAASGETVRRVDAACYEVAAPCGRVDRYATARMAAAAWLLGVEAWIEARNRPPQKR